VSADLVEDYVAKYEIMVAARESDMARLVLEYRDVPDVILCHRRSPRVPFPPGPPVPRDPPADA